MESMNKLKYFVSQNKKSIVGFTVAALVGAAIFYIAMYYANKHKFPCYCEKCESTIIDAANKGDPVAQRKLAEAIINVESAKGFPLGPLVAIGVTILLVVAASALTSRVKTPSYFTQQWGRQVV
jgi:riboflavin transporter FmnP